MFKKSCPFVYCEYTIWSEQDLLDAQYVQNISNPSEHRIWIRTFKMPGSGSNPDPKLWCKQSTFSIEFKDKKWGWKCLYNCCLYTIGSLTKEKHYIIRDDTFILQARFHVVGGDGVDFRSMRGLYPLSIWHTSDFNSLSTTPYTEDWPSGKEKSAKNSSKLWLHDGF